jgi:hypothetical protein
MKLDELREKLNSSGLEIFSTAEPFIDTDIPAYEFEAAIYDAAGPLVRISGWSLPSAYEYGLDVIEDLCDITNGDLLSAYGAVVCGEKYESQKPVVVIHDVKCELSALEIFMEYFPLIAEKIPYSDGTICALLSVKDESPEILRYMKNGWRCKHNDRGTWVAIRWQ